MLGVFCRSAVVVCLCASLVGCDRGPRKVTVTGRITRNGQPLTVGPSGYVAVTLRPDVGPDVPYTTYPVSCEPDGRFTIHDVPPGRYRVGIHHHDPTPQVDKLNWAFMPETSKIIREVDGKTPLEIDLAKLDLK
jgi:hypothetical protein